jgi:uncharacterized membrane protein (UPF0136 family)
MIMLASTVFGVFGLASIAGGVLGYKKAGSKASLIAGGASGTLLLVAAALSSTGATPLGLLLGGVTSALLGARFAPTFVKTRKWMPHGMMAALSAVGVAVAVGARLAT